MVREELIDWRYYTCGTNGQIYSFITKRYLSECVSKGRYSVVNLKCIDGKCRKFLWHRVIWTFFYGTIPEDKEINHVDENKQNNTLSNLSLCTHRENCNWGTAIERSATKRSVILKGHEVSEETKRKIGKALSKPVVAIDDDGNIVHEFASAAEAGRNGFNISHVAACCRGERRTHGGYGWRHP